jgi:outer membrane protein OmpA-like peptidoglycan-associated protein
LKKEKAMRAPVLKSLLLVVLIVCLGVLAGCATAEVKSASAAVEAARAAGKDKQCPSEFQAAEQLVARAQALCNQCKPNEANALANEAMAKVNALCPAKPTPPPAPEPVRTPVPPSVPAPSISISASPSSIDTGACTTLNWSATNTSSVAIDQGVGAVDPSGSRKVCPTSTTRYTLTANGPGGTREDSATVNVNAKPTPTDKLTIHVNFDTAKSDIRSADATDLKKAQAFVRKYKDCKIEVDGYTDSRGSDEYNQGLSERRADAVKKYLVDHHDADGDKITTKGFGKANPIGDNKTSKGRFENRRAEILIFCQ